jgi:hypothetical protein
MLTSLTPVFAHLLQMAALIGPKLMTVSATASPHTGHRRSAGPFARAVARLLGRARRTFVDLEAAGGLGIGVARGIACRGSSEMTSASSISVGLSGISGSLREDFPGSPKDRLQKGGFRVGNLDLNLDAWGALEDPH